MSKKCLLLFLIATMLSGFAYAQSPADVWRQDVGVEGTHLTLNGQPWRSRGVTLQGFVRPLALLESELAADPNNQQAATLLNARRNYGPAELEFARAFHANTLRFQVSQPALDPDSSLYSANYLDDVVDAVQTARRAGFVVMLMMQDEAITGDAAQAPLPTEETQNDWDLLAERFGNDRGVVFELYNEPGLLASDANWQLWLNGGQLNGAAYLGMQTLINHLRALGARNLFVLDGLAVNVVSPASGQPVREAAESLAGVPAVTDPLQRVAYAVHPYQHGLAVESNWEQDFGAASKTLPVWADEWSAPTAVPLALGTLPSYQVAVDLLNFLRRRSIPLCTGAIDVPQWVVQDIPGWTLTNYKDYSAASTTQGSGTLVFHDFADDYARPLTVADGQ